MIRQWFRINCFKTIMIDKITVTESQCGPPSQLL